MPRAFFSGFVIAKRRQTSAACPHVMKTFCPEMRYEPPSRTARVFWLAASEPASGSVKAKQPSFSPRASGWRKRFFWSSFPYFSIGSQTAPTAQSQRRFFVFEEIQDAHRLMDSNQANGKIVVAH